MNLRELCEKAGHETRSYSGRCMYGRTCLGVVVENVGRFNVDVMEEATKLLVVIPSGSHSTVADLLRSAKTDDMGLDTIIYFPQIPYEPNELDSDGKHETTNPVVEACAQAGIPVIEWPSVEWKCAFCGCILASDEIETCDTCGHTG